MSDNPIAEGDILNATPDTADPTTGPEATGTETVRTPDPAAEGDEPSGNREAAKYRTQLRATETERDQLREQIAAQRRAVVDWRAANNPNTAPVDPALLDAAGINVDDLLDDNGHVDINKVDEFVTATASRFRVGQGFRPNRAQGQSGNGAPVTKPSLADAFRQK